MTCTSKHAPDPYSFRGLCNGLESKPIVATVYRQIKYPLKLPHSAGPTGKDDLTHLVLAAFAHDPVVVQPTVRPGKLAGRGA